ncbi:TPA: biopolymer transporter ExbD [Candidatus Poribacteria bacterium]|nr:biopolymer transporter ExbD [Candidatus Poribacteria bacterium]HEX29222.1 biopolymer transporter ExbD [Candidatus Poribacteria bacterium]
MRRTEQQAMRGGRRRRAPKLDMAPLIDCVFLLLIFFMVSTTFAPMPGIRVKLPPPGRPSSTKPKGLVLRIADPEPGNPYGLMILNDQVVDMPTLFQRFIEAPATMKKMLIIQSGRQVLHQQIVEVMDLAKRAGIDKIGFAMVARGP